MSKPSKFAVVRGRRIEYRRFAATRRDAGTMVLLHEGLGSVSMWGAFPSRLAQATGYEVVVYSRFGYGQSDPRLGAFAVDYMHHEALEVLPEFLERLEITAPILLGHSNGASIAIIHAGVRGAEALVLEAPHVFVEDVCVEAIAAVKTTFETTDLRRKLGRHHADPEHAFRGWNDIWLHPDFRKWNIEEYLPRIECPALVIQGCDDEYGSMAHAQAIRRQAAGPVQIRALERCGHSPHRDQPEAVLEAVNRFLADIRPAAHSL
jgi:pimeloyl-ACP methyl ester carboxylesterase